MRISNLVNKSRYAGYFLSNSTAQLISAVEASDS